MANFSFFLLGLAIVGVWLPPISIGNRLTLAPWRVFFFAAILAAVGGGVLSVSGVAVLIALTATVFGSQRLPSPTLRALLCVLSGLIALGLALRLFPGFQNQKIYEGLRLSADAPLFNLNLNFGKGSAGLLLLVAYAVRIRQWTELKGLISTPRWWVVFGTPVVVIGISVVAGGIRFDPKWPLFALTFLSANLLFTCVAEEVFFRGLLQERLHRFFDTKKMWRWLPVVLVTGLFAPLHMNSDPAYLAVVTLAGLGYSLAYAMARRVEAAILTHFLVNAIHFLFFTYPYANPS